MCIKELGSVYKILVSKFKRMTILGTSGHKRENDIKIDVHEIRCASVLDSSD
jgi:hypothetical protein